MNSRLASILALAACFGGCANTNYAVFVTKTTLSIVDADTTPVEATIAFNRSEGYVGPRFSSGIVYPVTGFLQTSGSGFSRNTRQVFAGGAAAEHVLGSTAPASAGVNQKSQPPSPCSDGRERPPLFFATGTTLGLRVGFVDNTALPNSFTLGYRRKEAAAIPVADNCFPSVLAAHESDPSAREKAGDPKAGLALAQWFATGNAADTLAQDDDIRNLFKREAAVALTGVAAFNDRERTQLRATADILACAAAVEDDDFDTVIVSARELNLLPEKGDQIAMAAAKGTKRRAKYAELLGLRAGVDDPTRAAALSLHQKRVCGLRKA